jgi:hypothetical protein
MKDYDLSYLNMTAFWDVTLCSFVEVDDVSEVHITVIILAERFSET